MIYSTCVYLIDHDKWLMLYRNQKKNDINAGKYIGVGGKCEDGETFEQCAYREVKEETGLVLDELHYEGDVTFYYDAKLSEMIKVYTSKKWHGEMTACSEGQLVWVDESDIMSLNLWQGDRIFLKRMIRHDPERFHYVFYYDADDQLIKVSEKEE